MQIDAMFPTNVIDLALVTTPSVDLEIVGLEPGQDLRITEDTGDPVEYPDRAYPSGHLVLWEVAAVPGAISIRDAEDGTLMTLIALDQPTMPLAGPPPHNPNPECCRARS